MRDERSKRNCAEDNALFPERFQLLSKILSRMEKTGLDIVLICACQLCDLGYALVLVVEKEERFLVLIAQRRYLLCDDLLYFLVLGIISREHDSVAVGVLISQLHRCLIAAKV